jgi:hypothetical protein
LSVRGSHEGYRKGAFYGRKNSIETTSQARSQPKKSRENRRREENRERERSGFGETLPSLVLWAKLRRCVLLSIERSRLLLITPLLSLDLRSRRHSKFCRDRKQIRARFLTCTCRARASFRIGRREKQKERRKRREKKATWSRQWHGLSNVVELGKAAENCQRKNDAAPDRSSDVSIETSVSLIGD